MRRVLAWVLFVLGLLPAVAAAQPAVEADVPYLPGSSLPAHTLDIYGGGEAGTARPVVVYVHGGGWGRGDKRLGKSIAGIYVENNAILVSVNYRLAPQNPYPAFMHDLAAATRWVKDNIARRGGDPNRVVLVGHSAGAHIVALLGTDPQFLEKQGLPLNYYRAIVPIDTASFNFTVDPEGMFVRRQKKIREDAFGSDRERIEAASPTLVAARQRPGSLSRFAIFVSSKRADAVEQSEEFAKVLRKVGAEASVTRLDLGHAKMNQAAGDRQSPLAKTVLQLLAAR
jgi:arylformamidase